jgi:plasmid stabilization system protein ParE
VKPVALRQVAKRDLRAATAWYTERDADVAQRFTDEVARTLELIERFPATGAPVPGVSDNQVRRLPVHNFPYHIVFITLPDRVSVLAIAHDRRKPGYWTRT